METSPEFQAQSQHPWTGVPSGTRMRLPLSPTGAPGILRSHRAGGPLASLGSSFSPPQRLLASTLGSLCPVLLLPPHFALLFHQPPSRFHLLGPWLQSLRTPHFSSLLGVSAPGATAPTTLRGPPSLPSNRLPWRSNTPSSWPPIPIPDMTSSLGPSCTARVLKAEGRNF